MRVKIEYCDKSGATDKEIVSHMHSIFGDTVNVETYPDNLSAQECIKFAIEKLLTEDQAVLYFDNPPREYKVRLEEKLDSLRSLFNSLLLKVCENNENRWM